MSQEGLGIDNERASWLELPNPGLLESWRKRNDGYGDLMDGAYFGLNGASITDMVEKVVHGPQGSIIVHNPGLCKKSFLLPDLFAGRLLAILDKKGFPHEAITFPEAENAGWIKEKKYLDAWRYLGKECVSMFPRIAIAQKYIPEFVYQVTKKGVGKIAITEQEIQRTNILYFFGLRTRT